MISQPPVGTRHRNHCPICLWSKHVDHEIPGDRRSVCKSRMMPIGLKFKNLEENPFTNRVSGELMVVHACLGCDKISANRIAGDDNSYQLLKLLDNSEKFSYDFALQLAKKVLQYLQIGIERWW